MFEIAKRNKNLIATDYVLKDAYKAYYNRVEEPYKVSYKTYSKICKEFNKMVIALLLNDAEIFTMPSRMGQLFINRFNSKKDHIRYPIDYGESVKRGMLIRHLNDHSNGFQYSWKWNKNRFNLLNKEYYVFNATRTMKRTLAKMIKQNHMTYLGYGD